MGYLRVDSGMSGLGDSCYVTASGARVCGEAPTTPQHGGWRGGGRQHTGGGQRGGRGGSRHFRGQPVGRANPFHPWCQNPMTPTCPGCDASMLSGLGIVPIFRNTYRPVVQPFRRTSPTPIRPIAPFIPALPLLPTWNRNQGGQGRQQGRQRSGQWGRNNRRGWAPGTSNAAPWNVSPTCSDSTSQFYNPSDPSCSTGVNPICTDPTYPGYNPSDPSCPASAAAATTATTAATTTGTTDYSSWFLIGGAALVLILLLKK